MSPATNSEHLEFVYEGTSTSGKTLCYEVRSRHDGSLLALVRWYGPWRRYVVMTQRSPIFDAACLTEIADFLTGLMAERKASPAGAENEGGTDR